MAWIEASNTPDNSQEESCGSVSELKNSIDSALSDTILSPDEATQIQESAYSASIECAQEARNTAMELSQEILTQWINISAWSNAESRMTQFFKVDFMTMRATLSSQWIDVPSDYIARHDWENTVYLHKPDGTAIAQIDVNTWESGEVEWLDWWQKDSNLDDNMDAQMLIDQHEHNVYHTEDAAIIELADALSVIWDGQAINIMDRDMNSPDVLRTLAQSIWIWDIEQLRWIYNHIYVLWAKNRILSDYSNDVVSVKKDGDQIIMTYNGDLHPEAGETERSDYKTRWQVEVVFNNSGSLLREQITKY